MLRFWIPALSLTWAACALAETPDLGEVSPAWITDSERWDLAGCTVFEAADVRHKLATEFDVGFRMRSGTGGREFAELLREKLTLGYRHSGFPNPNVRVEPSSDGQRLAITIDEGRRCVRGRVLVLGHKAIDPAPIITRLTTRHIGDSAVTATFHETGDEAEVIWHDKDGKQVEFEDPAWVAGNYPSFNEQPADTLRPHVKQACIDQGYPDAWFTLRIIPDENTDTATLVVNIEDEGTPQYIRRIFFAGNHRNSDADVLTALNVQLPLLWTREERLRIEQKLWECGRFVSYKLEPNRLGGLRIELVESDFAPLLAEPLNREEELLLRCRRWLARSSSWEGDMVFALTSKSDKYLAAFSPKDGVAVRMTGKRGEGATAAELDESIIGTQDELQFFSAVQGRQLTAGFSSLKLDVCLGLMLKSDKGKQEMSFTSKIGWSERKEHDGPMELTFQASPAAILALARRNEPQVTFDGDIMTIVDDVGTRWCIDAARGHVKLFEIPRGENGLWLRVSVESGATAKLIAELRGKYGKLPNAFDRSRLVQSIGDFVCAEIEKCEIEDSTYNPARLRAALKLIDDPVIAPLERLWAESRPGSKDEKDEFGIPDRFGSEFARLYATGNYGHLAPLVVYVGKDEWIARDSPLWRISQEIVLDTFQIPAIDSAAAPLEDCGPLAHLLLAECFVYLKRPAPARLWARRGLGQLDAQQFADDMLSLFDDRYIIGLSLRRTIDSFRRLDKSDIDALTIDAKDPWSPMLRQLWELCQPSADKPLDEASRSICRAHWPLLRPVIERRLRQIAGDQ
jgi:hypothetical protein